MKDNQEPICGINGDAAYLRDGTNRLLADMSLSMAAGSAAPEYHHTHLLMCAIRALGLYGNLDCRNVYTAAHGVEFEGKNYTFIVIPEREL